MPGRIIFLVSSAVPRESPRTHQNNPLLINSLVSPPYRAFFPPELKSTPVRGHSRHVIPGGNHSHTPYEYSARGFLFTTHPPPRIPPDRAKEPHLINLLVFPPPCHAIFPPLTEKHRGPWPLPP